jgi:hypothetical protein
VHRNQPPTGLFLVGPNEDYICHGVHEHTITDIERKVMRSKLKREIYHFIFTAVIDTYRPIIHQTDVHHRLKDAVLDAVALIQLPYLCNETVVKFTTERWLCGGVKARLVALLRRGKERKL